MAVKFRVYLDSVFHKVCVCACLCAQIIRPQRKAICIECFRVKPQLG